MLELGGAGADGVLLVLRDGAPVATLRAGEGEVTATAEVGGQRWVRTRRDAELTARRGADPEDTVRLRARRTSVWKGTWSVDLEGLAVDVANTSVWRGTRRYSAAGRLLADSGSTGGWTPRPTPDADPALPLEHAVFLLWVELAAGHRVGDGAGVLVTGADGGADGGGGGGGGD